jgi:alpha-beta hydrolase superfamily lysophospholipase
MKHIEGRFAGVREMEIYYQGWLPEEAPKAVLLVVHGLGEHSGRYDNVVNHFVPKGYAVYSWDHIGHGKSAGEREMVETFQDFTETMKIYYQMVKNWNPGIPIFAVGHSMGGTITTYYLLDHQEDFQGAVISAALVKAGDSVSKFTIMMGKLMSRIAPKMGVLPLDPHTISKDPEVVQAYIADPLVFHAKSPARLGTELLAAMARITAEVEKIKLPFITVQGSEDALVDPVGAEMLHDQAGSQDKTIKIYPGLYHEVFNEPEREQVLNDVEQWLEQRL